MRLRHFALGCALAGGLGLLAAPGGPALAAGKPAGPRISVSAPATDNPYDARITLTVTLRPALTDREVSLYAAPAGGARALVAAGTVDADGKWHVRYTITTATTFTAYFPGDAGHASAWASRTLYAHARVTDRLGGAYATSRGGGVVYDVFRGTGTLTLYSTVAPDSPGECLEPESEQYDKGAGWDADTKYGCDKLDGASHDTAPFSLKQAVGDRYRIRGDYLPGRGAANLSGQGPWLYFTVER